MVKLATMGKTSSLALTTLSVLLLGGLAYGGTGAIQAAHQERNDAQHTHDPSGSDTDLGDETPSVDDGDDVTPSEPNAQTDPDRDSGQSSSNDDDQSSDASDASDGSDTSESPTSSDTIDENVIHIIQYGETMTSISAEYGVPIGILAEENNIENIHLIYADASMLIPYETLSIPVDWNE